MGFLRGLRGVGVACVVLAALALALTACASVTSLWSDEVDAFSANELSEELCREVLSSDFVSVGQPRRSPDGGKRLGVAVTRDADIGHEDAFRLFDALLEYAPAEGEKSIEFSWTRADGFRAAVTYAWDPRTGRFGFAGHVWDRGLRPRQTDEGFFDEIDRRTIREIARGEQTAPSF